MTTTHTAWLFSYRNQRTAKRMNREPRLAKLSKRWNGSLLARRNFFLLPRIFLSSSLASNLFQKAPWNTKMGFLQLSDSPQYLLGTISKQTLSKECYNLILSKHWYRTICDDPCEIWLRPRPRQATRQPPPALRLNLLRHLHQAGMTTSFYSL